MDPSTIEEHRSTPEIKYMLDKIDACRKKLRERGIDLPSQPFQAPSQPFQMQFNMRNH